MDHDFHSARADRRRWTRARVALPCKARLAGEVRFAPGVTQDASAGGACIEVRSARAIEPGERLELLLAHGQGGVIEAKAARPARIVRARRTGTETWCIALAYDEAAALAA
jgi:hypothetical protein